MPDESLTKLALNNTIVEMRKNVRQSRVQSINKLTKEIRRLKGNKGTEEQISRNLKKVERLTEQMAVMKKVNPDVVSKFALQNEKSLVEITNDVNETIVNKALARLACHKSVHQKVLEFRQKYPDWKKSFAILLDSLGEKYKNKKRTPVVSKKKEKKLNSTGKNKNFDDEDLQAPKTHKAGSIRSSSGLWTVTTRESEDSDSKEGESEDTAANFIPDQITGNISNSDKDCNHEDQVADLQKSTSKARKSQVPVRNTESESSTKMISNGNLTSTSPSLVRQKMSMFNSKSDSKKSHVSNKSIETESTVENVESVPLKNVESNKRPKKISNLSVPEVAADPFFITRDNTEYLSVSAKQVCDTEEPPIEYKKPRRMNPQSERFPVKSKQFKPNSNNFSGKKKNFESIRGKPDNVKDDSATTSLHPSWIAKKKQSVVIQNSQFQGKKIKFDD